MLICPDTVKIRNILTVSKCFSISRYERLWTPCCSQMYTYVLGIVISSFIHAFHCEWEKCTRVANVNNAIRVYTFEVGWKGVVNAVNGLMDTSSQSTHHHHCLSPIIYTFKYLRIWLYLYITLRHGWPYVANDYMCLLNMLL